VLIGAGVGLTAATVRVIRRARQLRSQNASLLKAVRGANGRPPAVLLLGSIAIASSLNLDWRITFGSINIGSDEEWAMALAGSVALIWYLVGELADQLDI